MSTPVRTASAPLIHTGAASSLAAGAGAGPSRRNLQHLVGRQLVPFFLPSETSDDMKENTSHVMPHADNDFTQGISTVPVRTFVDGYFVDSGTLTDSKPTVTTSTTEKRHKKTPQQTPVKAKKDKDKEKDKDKDKQQDKEKLPSASASAAAPTTSSSSSSSSSRFAAPAFCNSPSPMKIPLPKFITQTSTMTAVPERDESQVSRPIGPQHDYSSKHPHPHPHPHQAMHLWRAKSVTPATATANAADEPEHHYTSHKKSPSLPPNLVMSTPSTTSTSATSDPGQALIQLLRAGTYAHPTAHSTTSSTATSISSSTTGTLTETTTGSSSSSSSSSGSGSGSPTVTTPRLLLLRQDSTGAVAVQSIPVSAQEPDYSSKIYRLPNTSTGTSTPAAPAPAPAPALALASGPFFPPTMKAHTDDAAHLQATLKSLLSIR